ncbi:MAG: HAD hydrolase-like protein [Bacteroidota bacterium]|nr:HAD hydrolase-like protein [Bacteroidota bacterium]
MKGTYSHIIWDYNGTLLDDAWLCVEVMNKLLKQRNLPLLTLERYRSIFDFPVQDYYELLGFDFNKESFSTVGMEFIILYDQRKKECSMHQGVLEILKSIHDQGYHQCILSAREQNELRQETRELEIAGYFDLIYGLEDHFAHGKADVGIRLIHDLKGNKEKYLFIGDTCHDSEVADELGIQCMLIPHGHHSIERLEKCHKPIIQSFQELMKLL